LYVTGCTNHRIGVFASTPPHRFLRHIGRGPGSGAGELRSPTASVVLDDGSLNVVDHNGRISVFNAASGQFTKHVGTRGNGPGQLQKPCGLAAGDGFLYVADGGNDCVSVFRLPSYDFVQNIGRRGNGPGELMSPRDVVVAKGLVYVVDYRVSVFDAADGSFVRHIGQGVGNKQTSVWQGGRRDPKTLCSPDGLAVWNGVLYVSDWLRLCAFRIEEGEFLWEFGVDNSSKGGKLHVAAGILYLTGEERNSIAMFQL
jgi:DNA-binding beta-propeller fold protein YncE